MRGKRQQNQVSEEEILRRTEALLKECPKPILTTTSLASRNRVWTALGAGGKRGLTKKEIAAITDDSAAVVAARVRELMEAGKVEPNGKRIYRLTTREQDRFDRKRKILEKKSL